MILLALIMPITFHSDGQCLLSRLADFIKTILANSKITLGVIINTAFRDSGAYLTNIAYICKV
jgi:hypothetical protein